MTVAPQARRYPDAIKIAVARSRLAGASINSLSGQYGVNRDSVRNWTAQYEAGELPAENHVRLLKQQVAALQDVIAERDAFIEMQNTKLRKMRALAAA